MADVNSTVIREELHALLDHIPDSDISAAREYLRSLVDPAEFILSNAPADDEPLSAHEREAIEEAIGREQPYGAGL